MRDKIKPEEIKSLRKSLFLSQQELADKLSVSQRIVSYWDRGLYSPNLEHQAKLDALLNAVVSSPTPFGLWQPLSPLKLQKKRLYIFDLPSLLKKEGKEDFLNTLFSLMRDSPPEYIAAACDDMQKVKKSEKYNTFHTDMAEVDSSFIIEFEQTKEIISALGISVVLKYGVETAEILATLTDRALFLGFEVDIVTSDVLLLQLLEPKVRVHFNLRKGIVYDYDEFMFKKEYSLEPKKYPDYLSLVGLKEKSIPGVGIEDKSASELINSFKTLENMLENIDKVESKWRHKLQEDRAIALIGKRLALLSPDVELLISPEDCFLKERDNERLFSLAKEQESLSLLQFLEESLGRKEREYHTVQKVNELEELLGKLKSFPEFAIDFLTTDQAAMKAEIVGIAISPGPNLAYYIPVKNYYEQSSPMQDVCGMLLNIPRTRPNAITGEPTLIDADDLNAAFFRTTTNILGDYMLSRITPGHGEWGFEVVGEEGALMGFLTRGDRDELRLLRVGGDWETVPLPPETQIHEPLTLGRMMRSFVDAILRGAPDSVWDATFFDGYRAQVVLSAIKQSVQEKRWVEVKPFTSFKGKA